MKPVLAVVRREYVQRVRSKWFVLTTLGAPVAFLAIVLLPFLFGTGADDGGARNIVVLDRTGVLYAPVAAHLEDAGFEVEPADAADAADPNAEERLRRRARAGDVGGLLVLDDASLDRGSAVWVGRSAPSTMRRMVIRQAVRQGALEQRLAGRAEDVEALLAGGELRLDILTGDAAGTGEAAGFEEPRFVAVYAGTFLLYMVILGYAVAVMRSVLEEKTSRVVEVIVSAVRPWHLMLGKILGVGAVGLTQLAAWGLLAVLALLAGLPALMAARPELVDLAEWRRFIPGLEFLGLFLLFFVGGYFLYSSLYAAIGAMCSTDQEAQQAQLPAMLLLVAPAILLVGVMEEPNATGSVALSFIPFFSPILMFARAGLGAAPAWQVALSLVLVAATVVGVAWVAGRIYRTGILMAGKRPTLPELWRWVREA